MSETKFTPGPWRWFGTPTSGFYLATNHSGRRYVMDFVRMGMSGAQPRFQPGEHGMKRASDLCIFEVCRDATSAKDPRVYRRDVVGFRAPDANLIAAAPELYEALENMANDYEEFEFNPKTEKYDKPTFDPDILSRARAALAKARGEAL